MKQPCELSDEQRKAIHDACDELVKEMGKPKKEEKMVAGGLIPTCCDRCREKDLYRGN
jgi:hypothetical protein